MTIKQLKEIIANLPDETPIIIFTGNVYDVGTILAEYHSDGRKHLIISNKE